MSVITTYRCDNCYKEQYTSEQFWNLCLTVRHQSSTTVHSVKDHCIQLCRPCLESFGILVQENHVTEKAYPTTEELIKEIIGRCIEIQEVKQ